MKQIIFSIILITTLFSCKKETPITYCGKIVDLPTYYSGPEGKEECYVIFYNDSIKRNIAVEVTWNCYHNCVRGKEVCFELTERQITK